MGLLNEIAEKLLKNFLSLKEDDWIEWIAQPNDWQDACDKFNGCYFIVKQMPKYPQHPRCQCRLNKSRWDRTTCKLWQKGTIDLVTPYSGHSY